MNEEDVRFTYRFLAHERETEVRLIDPRGVSPSEKFDSVYRYLHGTGAR